MCAPKVRLLNGSVYAPNVYSPHVYVCGVVWAGVRGLVDQDPRLAVAKPSRNKRCLRCRSPKHSRCDGTTPLRSAET